MSGWPSGVVCAESVATRNTTAAPTAKRALFMATPPRLFGHVERGVERVTLVLEHLDVLFHAAVERHPHLPGPREHLRILDRDFVVDVIRIRHRVALDDVQLVAVEVAGAIEPGLVVE